MRLADIDILSLNEHGRELSARGMTVLDSIDLPRSFEPPRALMVFLQDGDECVVHLGADVRYLGSDPRWRSICEREATSESTREVTAVRGDFVTAVNAMKRLLDLAGSTPDPTAIEGSEARPQRHRGRAPRLGRTPRLRDLVAEQRERPREYVGRQRELASLKASLSRQNKPGTVLVGLPGVGKTALIEMLAAESASGSVPRSLVGVPILELPLGMLLESGGVVGDLERQLRQVIEQNHGALFFIDEIHQIGRRELRGLADLLKPALASGRIRVVGATTPAEWRRLEDAAFKRRFVELQVDEPPVEDAYRVLQAKVPAITGHHGIRVHDRMLREAVLLAERYLPMRRHPDKAIDVLDQAAALQASRSEADEGAYLDRAWLYRAVAAQGHVDESLIDAETSEDVAIRAGAALHNRLHGQARALNRLVGMLRAQLLLRGLGWDAACAALSPNWDQRPLAAVLSCGPTGVGKSETARILADVLYCGRLLVLNGSDVGVEAPHGTAMWTGAPPGYVGSHQGGVLTNGLRENPASVILVDELEKASPEAIQHVLLPLLGDGTVADRNTGETLSASNCLVIATSNIPLERPSLARVGFTTEAEREPSEPDVYEALLPYLKPEVIGRFNVVLRYVDLTQESQWQIWDTLTRRLERRIGEHTTIRFDPAAVQLIDDGFVDLNTGARGINDLFRRLVVPLARGAVAGDTLSITARGATLALDPEHNRGDQDREG